MKKLNQYHQPIVDRIPDMDNKELLEQYLDAYLGDGEDGYSSDSNNILVDELWKELESRLIKIGFLNDKQ